MTSSDPHLLALLLGKGRRDGTSNTEELLYTDYREIPAESLPVRNIVVGANGRIALLLSSEEHESWCNHNAHVVVCHWNKQFSLPQAVCPTAAARGNQGLLAVATHSGNIDLYHGQQLLSSTQVHDGPVTAIDWTDKELISCGTDGTVVILSVRGYCFRKRKDSPSLRGRSASSDTPWSALVPSLRSSIPCSFWQRSQCDSETGGIWRMTLQDLSVVPSVDTPLAIQKLLLLPEGRMVVADVESKVAFLSPDGNHAKIFGNLGSVESDSLMNTADWLFTLRTLLVSSDEVTITIVDALSLSLLFFCGSLKLKALAAFRTDEIVILNEHNELQIYGIKFLNNE